ncbi:MAG: FAD/NAD(P)-binding oxidoreductase [Orrella sp.]
MTQHIDRRTFLMGAAALSAVGFGAAPVAVANARADVVIVGAGAAGLSVAARLAKQMPNAKITIFDARRDHYFQPGWTLVGAGWWQPGQTVDSTRGYIPDGVNWVEQNVAEIDPDGNSVTDASGKKYRYDWLFVTSGLSLDYDKIDGMDRRLIGNKGIASIYAGPEAAGISHQVIRDYLKTGGVSLFGRPATEMKCAGAPLKMTFITDDLARRAGVRGNCKIVYTAHSKGLFAIQPVDVKVKSLFEQRDIEPLYDHVLTAIDPDAKRATYRTPNGAVSLDYDMIHVIPPMSAPQAVRNSPLPWQTGPNAADGWIEVSPENLRSPRYPNVFAVGDVAGVPRGKTAASVKWQVPVAVDHMIAAANGQTSSRIYNGYTSCPMVTGLGKAMLIEFDYAGNLTPSFPFIDPLEELWISWFIEEKALLGTYRAMLRGYA